MQVGLVVIDENPARALEVVRAADAAGVHSIWTIDYYNRSSLTRAAAFAAVTEQVVIGTSVTPLFARAPLALASAASDIQTVAGGRFVLGVGSSTRRMNEDWYGVPLEHPAPQVAERIDLLRAMVAHRSGPFAFDGRFDRARLAHFDRTELRTDLPILVAGVGDRMVQVAGTHGDGFVGHPIASVEYLATIARPALDQARVQADRDGEPFRMTSQIIATAGPDREAARSAAAGQVGFYSTVKGYDALFVDGVFGPERLAAREAFVQGDAAAVARAARPMVDERAVYGTPDEVAKQLARYEDALDLALLYPPHYGVGPEEITANELALIEVASCWVS